VAKSDVDEGKSEGSLETWVCEGKITANDCPSTARPERVTHISITESAGTFMMKGSLSGNFFLACS
jgi:hypothetical protein